jgi:hypothetical protein
MHRQSPLEEAQSDRRNFSDGKMDPKQIVHHPVHPSQPLQSCGCFGIPMGLSSQGGPCSAQGTPERFGMIGMDIRLGNGTSCVRMFPPGALLCEALSTFFMRLCTFLLEAEVHPSFACLLGASWFSMVYKCITSLKEQMPLAPFTIGQDAQITSLSRHLVPCLDRLLTESSILLATSERSHASTGSVHEP